MISEARIPFYLVFKQLVRGNKWTLALTIFLMSIAFINLIFITSLFNGIIEGSNQQIIDTLSGHIVIVPKEGEDFIPDTPDVIEQIKKNPHVIGVSSQSQVPANLKYKNIKGNWRILAIDPENNAEVTKISSSIIDGRYLESDDKDGILIGRQIAGGKDVEMNATSFKSAKPGEVVTLSFDGVQKEMTIRGVYYTKFINADDQAFITNAAYEQLLPQIKGLSSSILVRLDDKANIPTVIDALEKDHDLRFWTWEEMAGLMKTVNKSFLSINVVITMVGILIAAVTIFIIIYIDTVHNRKQIGILRAIGIRPYIIVFSYVIQSAVYAVLGVAFGSLIYFFAIVPYFNAHPFELPIGDARLVSATADFIFRAQVIMWVAVISGFIPAVLETRRKLLHSIWGN